MVLAALSDTFGCTTAATTAAATLLLLLSSLLLPLKTAFAEGVAAPHRDSEKKEQDMIFTGSCSFEDSPKCG